MKPTLLITGGSGYIGSHTVVALEQAGYETIIIDNFSNSDKKTLDGITNILGYSPLFYQCDLLDIESLEAIFQTKKIDGVIHFAGLKAVGESCEKPFLYYENNIVGSINLFKLMEKYAVRKLVFSSSATVYDAKNIVPFQEESLLGTTNPYGTTKLIIEKIIDDISTYLGWKSISLRYFNPIGAHTSGNIGENPKGIPNNILPYIMKVASGELREINIFGDDYQTKDGTGVRDYIDVVDLANAHIQAYKKIESTTESFIETINIGTGKGVSVKELITEAEKAIGKELPKKVTGRRSGDIGEVYASVEYAKEFLSWEAKTPLQESLKNSWNFIQKQAS